MLLTLEKDDRSPNPADSPEVHLAVFPLEDFKSIFTRIDGFVVVGYIFIERLNDWGYLEVFGFIGHACCNQDPGLNTNTGSPSPQMHPSMVLSSASFPLSPGEL